MTPAPLPALTLWEPWASCVAAGMKHVETRSWKLPRHRLGVRFALGAAATWHADAAGDALLMLGNVDGALDRLAEHLAGDPWKSASYPLGCVVATAVPTICLPAQNVTLGGHELDGPRTLYRTVGWGPQLLRVPLVERVLGGYDVGRFATLLADVEPVTPPVPARGRQGWWTWQPA